MDTGGFASGFTRDRTPDRRSAGKLAERVRSETKKRFSRQGAPPVLSSTLDGISPAGY
jgi:hypothetical protein